MGLGFRVMGLGVRGLGGGWFSGVGNMEWVRVTSAGMPHRLFSRGYLFSGLFDVCFMFVRGP